MSLGAESLAEAVELLRKTQEAITESVLHIETAQQEAAEKDEELAATLHELDEMDAYTRQREGSLVDCIQQLHREAHGDDKMPFRRCIRQVCRDLQEWHGDLLYDGLVRPA